MTTNCFILEILMNSYGRKAIWLRSPLLQELEKCKIETRSKLVFIFILEVQVYLFITRSLGSIKLDRVISETRYSDLGKEGYELKLD